MLLIALFRGSPLTPVCVTCGASLVLALQATNTGIESVISQLFYEQAQQISIAHVFNVVIYTAITNEFSDNSLLMRKLCFLIQLVL